VRAHLDALPFERLAFFTRCSQIKHHAGQRRAIDGTTLWLVPAADGVVPERYDDFDEWGQFRHSFCKSLRTETSASALTGAPFPAVGFREGTASCTPEPTYAR